MYNTTDAVKSALGHSVVHMRLLSESVSLLAPDSKPIQSSDGKPIWLFAGGPFPDGRIEGEQLTSLSYSAGCCDGDIGIGNVSSASLSGTIHGVLNLLNMTFTAKVGVDVDGKTQWMNLGKFTVTESTRTDDSTTFTAYDAAYTVFGQTYTPAVLSGSTGRAILEDISRQTGIEVEPSTLAMCTMQTDGALTGHTYREMVGYIAALCGKNAVITRDGFLRFVWFSSTSQAVTADDYYSGDMSNGGKSKLHGIACTIPATEDDRETQTITVGEAEKAIEIVNPYMTQSMLNSVWSLIGDYEYPVGSVGFYKGILTEPGDIISLTNLAGVTISFPVMQVSLEIDGGCRCSAISYGKSEADRGTGVKSPVLSAFNRVLDGVANGVYDGTSVASVTRFYQLGDTAPATPTTKNPPSGWGTTEPGYSENNPEHLYFVDRTVYDNDTYQYSTVSLSSSYEAAKDAHARAVAAKEAADAAQETADTAQEAADDAQEAADDAQEAADTAQATANTAKTTADTAKTTADAAASAAAAAQSTANRAMTSANGKNKVFHQSTAPSSDDGLTAGDIWFNTANDNQINTWTGSAWSAFELGEDAIADLSITNAKIANGTIANAKIANLDAGKITSGTIDAARINTQSLFSQDVTISHMLNISTDDFSLSADNSGFSISAKDRTHYSTISATSTSVSISSESTVTIGARSGVKIYDPSSYPGETTLNVVGSIQESGTALADKYSKKLSVSTKYIMISDVAAGDTDSGSFSASRTGYTPLAVAGYTTGIGTGNSLFNVSRLYLDGNNIKYLVRNLHDSISYDCNLTVYVLYVKN